MSVSNFAIVRQLDILTVFTKQTALAQFLAVFFCAIFPGAVISSFTQLQTIYFLSEHLFEAAQEIVGLCLGEAERRKEA